MSLITIAREFGSGGKDIAQLIADRLDYDCVDKQLIGDIAQATGVSEEVVAQIDEVGESPVRRFLRELFTPSNIYSLSPEYPPLIWPYVPSADLPSDKTDLICGSFLDRDEYLKILQETIRTLAKRGNVVIVGRGSQCILKDYPKALHVRFVAPLEYRIQRIMEEEAIDQEQAKQMIQEKDKQREYYLQHNYQENWRDPKLYHLILNTQKSSWDHLVDLVVQSIHKVE